MGEVIILLGSNIEPQINIRRGADLLSAQLTVVQASSVWITPSVGSKGPDFLNAAVRCKTKLDAGRLKFNLLRPIEEKMGRIRSIDKYAPRTLDLDAIILNNIILEPRLWDTAFILLPVAELTPDFLEPKTNNTLSQLAKQIEPVSGATRMPAFPLFEI